MPVQTSEFLRPFRLLVGGVRGCVGLAGMIMRDLRVLRCIRRVTLFMGFCGTPVRFSCFIVMRGGFVVVVLWHYGSYHC